VSIQVKRAYDPPSSGDGARYLVDRLWPRGIKKEALEIEAWVKDIAPSDALRKWFGHDPAKWDEFRKRYFEELRGNEQAWRPLAEAARRGRITLVFGAKDAAHNQAVALKEFLEQQLRRKQAGGH
jgi:uncharacterized protein YeaO (DUF488 family)